MTLHHMACITSMEYDVEKYVKMRYYVLSIKEIQICTWGGVGTPLQDTGNNIHKADEARLRMKKKIGVLEERDLPVRS